MMNKNVNNAQRFETTRTYLAGKKLMADMKKEKLIALKEEMLFGIMELKEALDKLEMNINDKFTQEIVITGMASNAWQEALIRLDTEEIELQDREAINKEAYDFSMEQIKELNNIETSMNLITSRLVSMFSEKPKGPQVVKRTVVTESKAKDGARLGVELRATVDEEMQPIVQLKDQQIAETLEGLFKKPFQYNPYPEEYYIRPNGYVNNMFVGERLYEYMKDYEPTMSTKEMGEWIKEMFPNAVNRWSTIEKGVANVVHLHLKKNNLIESVSNGVYKVKGATI